MSGNDISIRMPDGRFNLRVGAIILRDGRILMVRNDPSTYYYTVGGRVKFGESARETLLREVYEETQLRLEIERLAFVHENFFTDQSSDEAFHEVCFFFLMKPGALPEGVNGRTFTEDYGGATLHWLAVDGLARENLYPEFFKTELARMTDEVGYFVTRDDRTVRG